MRTPHAPRPVAARLAAIARPAALALVLASVGCKDSGSATSPTNGTTARPEFTMGSGTQSTLLGRATFAGAFKVERETGNWEIEVKAKSSTDVAVQSITFQPGSQSGWHQHPGPVFIQVVSGTIAFYDSDDPTCTPIIRTAGQGFLDTGEHAHIARNETGTPATNVVTYFAPPGAALRIDAPAPGNCPF